MACRQSATGPEPMQTAGTMVICRCRHVKRRTGRPSTTRLYRTANGSQQPRCRWSRQVPGPRFATGRTCREDAAPGTRPPCPLRCRRRCIRTRKAPPGRHRIPPRRTWPGQATTGLERHMPEIDGIRVGADERQDPQHRPRARFFAHHGCQHQPASQIEGRKTQGINQRCIQRKAEGGHEQANPQAGHQQSLRQHEGDEIIVPEVEAVRQNHAKHQGINAQMRAFQAPPVRVLVPVARIEHPRRAVQPQAEETNGESWQMGP